MDNHFDIGHDRERLSTAIRIAIGMTGVLWLIKSIEYAASVKLYTFGILPREWKGLIGILLSPLIHGDMMHLISNTIPLMVLGILLIYFYQKIALEVMIWIYLVSGFWTWMVARPAYHIGASGIIYGLAFFLLVSGFIRNNRQLMATSGVILVLYGGLLHGLFPGLVSPEISWESHFTGSLAGIVLAFLFKKHKSSIDHEDDLPDEDQDEREYFSEPVGTDDIDVNYQYRVKTDKPD